MRQLLLALFIICAINCTCIAQENYIFRGNQRFKATSSWAFNVENYPLGGLNVQIARSGTAGFILLEIENQERSYIVEKLIIYLQNGQIISCVDRGVRDRTNGKSRTLYSFTSDEMAMLAESNLSQVRFTFGGVNKYSDNRLRESYIAENINMRSYESAPYATAEEVASLME